MRILYLYNFNHFSGFKTLIYGWVGSKVRSERRFIDHYQVLGISFTASREKIKSAYRFLAKKYHPDRNKSIDAEKKFKEINDSYDVLFDPKLRAEYDLEYKEFQKQQAKSNLNEASFKEKSTVFDHFSTKTAPETTKIKQEKELRQQHYDYKSDFINQNVNYQFYDADKQRRLTLIREKFHANILGIKVEKLKDMQIVSQIPWLTVLGVLDEKRVSFIDLYQRILKKQLLFDFAQSSELKADKFFKQMLFESHKLRLFVERYGTLKFDLDLHANIYVNHEIFKYGFEQSFDFFRLRFCEDQKHLHNLFCYRCNGKKLLRERKSVNINWKANQLISRYILRFPNLGHYRFGDLGNLVLKVVPIANTTVKLIHPKMVFTSSGIIKSWGSLNYFQ